MRHQAVLFDLDNTLHDRDAGVVAFLHNQHSERRMDTLGVVVSEWIERFVWLEQGGRVWKDVVYERLCEEFGLSISPHSLLADYEARFAYYVRPHEGLVEMLEALRDRGWRTGVITNGRSQFQRKTLSALSIQPLLDVVVVSEECGLRKPQPAIFHLALDAIGCAAEGSWFVGDDLVADVEGAFRVEMRALWFRKDGVTGSDGSIGRLTDIIKKVGNP